LNKIYKGEGYWVKSLTYLDLDINKVDNNVTNEVNNTNKNEKNDDNFDVNYISKYLIDKPMNFKLSDIAGKTFNIIVDNKLKEISFDNNGNAVFDGLYNIKFKDGIIKVYKNGILNSEFKKIKSNENGIILLKINYDKNNTYENLDGWSTKFNPIDMSVLNYPKIFYNQKGDKLIIKNNIITYSNGYEQIYIIKNGAIITEKKWENDTGMYGFLWRETFQIVNEIENYYIVKRIGNGYHWNVFDDLKGKTFDDIIDSNITIDDMYLHSDGSVSFDYNTTDENVTFIKINPNEINVTKCYKNDEKKCSSELMQLDSNTGKIIKFYPQKIWQEIYSESPIINKPENY
jgi:hypothetical protein